MVVSSRPTGTRWKNLTAFGRTRWEIAQPSLPRERQPLPREQRQERVASKAMGKKSGVMSQSYQMLNHSIDEERLVSKIVHSIFTVRIKTPSTIP